MIDSERTVRIYKLSPEYDAAGDNASAWVDDGTMLMDLDIYRRQPMSDTWPSNLRFPLADIDSRTLTDVLFNPDGLVFSQGVRAALRSVLAEVEWLPLEVIGHGKYYLLHPLCAVDLGPDAGVQRNSISKNITVVTTHHFVNTESLPACFLLNQPQDSAAGKGGFCMRGIYVNQSVYNVLKPFSGIDCTLVYSDAAG